MSQRFYCPAPPVDGLYRLDADESKHLTRVSRHAVGDVVQIFDGRGAATAARVVAVGKGEVLLEAEGPPLPDRSPDVVVEMATAVPKGDRFDWLVEKAVEIGVSRVVPLITERSVVDPRDSKIERLRRTIVEASKQSGRSRLMELAAPEELATYLQREEGVRLIADPSGVNFDAWPAIVPGATIRMVVGPEGGLSDEETTLAAGLGWTPVGLAAAILRIETAVLVGAASILARRQPVH